MCSGKKTLGNRTTFGSGKMGMVGGSIGRIQSNPKFQAPNPKFKSKVPNSNPKSQIQIPSPKSNPKSTAKGELGFGPSLGFAICSLGLGRAQCTVRVFLSM